TGSLVVTAVQRLDGDQQAFDAVAVTRASDAAFLARERSRTEFEHLGTARAIQVAREVFPAVVEHRAGGTPVLGPGERIARYIAPNAAQLTLPHGRRAVLESTDAGNRDGGRPLQSR